MPKLTDKQVQEILHPSQDPAWSSTTDPNKLNLAKDFLENIGDVRGGRQVSILNQMMVNPNIKAEWMMPNWQHVLSWADPGIVFAHKPVLYEQMGSKMAQEGVDFMEPSRVMRVMQLAKPEDGAAIARQVAKSAADAPYARSLLSFRDLPATIKPGSGVKNRLEATPEQMEFPESITNAFRTALQQEQDPEVAANLTHTMSQLGAVADSAKFRDAIMASKAPKGVLVLDPELRKKMSDQEIADSFTQLENNPVAMYHQNHQTIPDAKESLKSNHPGAYKILTDQILNNPLEWNAMGADALRAYNWHPTTKDEVRKAAEFAGGSPDRFLKNAPDEKQQHVLRKWLHEVMLEDSTGTGIKAHYADPHRTDSDVTPKERYEVWKSLPDNHAAFEQAKDTTVHWFPHMEHDMPVADIAKHVSDLTPGNYRDAQALLSMPGGPELFRQRVLSSHKNDKQWRNFVMALKPENLRTIFRNEDIKQMVAAQEKSPRAGYKTILEAIQGAGVSQLGGISRVKVSFAEKLRAARDFLEERGGSAHYKELEKIGLNPKALGIEHLRNPKNQHIASQDVQNEIDKHPSMEYAVGHTKWTSSLQNHWTKTPNYVFQLKMTPEIEKKLKDALVWDDFQKLHKMSYGSGHPVDEKTLGWVRYSMGPEGGAHIDEIQSDLGQHTARQLEHLEREGVTQRDVEEVRQHAGDEAAAQVQAQAGSDVKRNSRHMRYGVETASDIVWGGKHPSEVLHHAFLQAMRDSGLHGADVHIWTAEPKSEISGQRQHSRGYEHDELQKLAAMPVRPEPTNASSAGEMNPHAWSMLKGAGAIGSPEKTSEFFAKHKNPETNTVEVKRPLPVHMRETYGDQPRQMGYKESEYGQVPVQGSNEHKGKKTWAQKLRKSEDSIRFLCDRVAYLSWFVGMRDEKNGK